MRLPFPILRTSALAGALVVTLVATGVDHSSTESVWLSGAQTASGYTAAAGQVGAGQGLAAAAPVGTVIEAAAGAGHAFGWQTAGGKGSTSRLWRSADASFSFTGTPEALTVSAADSTSSGQVTFTAPSGRVLEPGTFATGDGSALGWSDKGTCSSETHTFTITSLIWAADGTTLTGLDATFAGSCGTSAKGRVLINVASPPAPATATVTVTSVRYTKLGLPQRAGTKLAVSGRVECGGAARVTLTGRLLTSPPVAFTATVVCAPGKTVLWSVNPISVRQIKSGTAGYWVSGSVFDSYYQYAGDVLTKDKTVTVRAVAALPRK
ncbi:hypothetical protein HDA40_004420 [Hamadaea flava]|uniref:Uncharacterized protein n=1 Tax=Hamadaea flava TaxID=1742688 RepID=A0ABV8LE62_9ACTN|nr:hypothetical protein [Hamadaea flava]MCP2325913.1 hypothetical protein [Hamadaea flava]